MEGFWLISYIALWLFVSLQALLVLALLRHIGNLRLWLRQAGVIRDVASTEDGPPLGAEVTEFYEVLHNIVEPPVELENHKAKMLVFVPTGFFGCDDLIPAIRDFEGEYFNDFQTILVSFEPGVEEQFEVARRQGVKAPIVLKHSWEVSRVFHVMTAPYAVMVDGDNVARAKMPVSNWDGLQSLLESYQQSMQAS